MTVLAPLDTCDSIAPLRRAVRDDVPAVVDLFVDDPLGITREGTDAVGLAAYVRALEVGADPDHLVVRAEDEARRRACALIQLASDERRSDARRFSTRLGCAPSHEGVEQELPR